MWLEPSQISEPLLSEPLQLDSGTTQTSTAQTAWSTAQFPSPQSRNTRSNLTKIRWMLWILSLSLLVGGGWLLSRLVFTTAQSLSDMRTTPIERRTLPMTITANGTVQPERSINISPKTAGILKKLLVDEGDTVQQGQVIAYMDDKGLQAQLMQAKATLSAAQFNLQELLAGNRPQDVAAAQAKLDESRATLKAAELSLSQDRMLHQAGALSQRDLDNSQAKRDTALAQLTQSQQALSLQQAGPRVEEVAAAKAQVTAQQGAVEQIQTQLDDRIIRAPFSGRVIRKYANPGAFVTPTTAASSENSATSSSILAIATENQVVANVAETSLGKLRVGQPVKIKADAFPDKLFSGNVMTIAPQSTVKQNVTSFEVKVSLNDPETTLRAGMNVDIDVQVGNLENAVLVPTVAIVRQAAGTGVYVRTGDQVQFRPIESGVTIGNQTEVRSGLTGNEQVLLSFPDDSRPSSLPPFPQ